jgi:hypothetical protein
MLKKYPEKNLIAKSAMSSGPSVNVLNALLNYSKSVKVAQVKKEKLLVHLN